LQKFLFKALKRKSQEKRIIIATHSHLFLDREKIGNNYVCKRNRKNKIVINRIENEIEIRNKTFELLGNELKDFGLPERIIIVEGDSDKIFIDTILRLLKKNYNTFSAGCDNKITSATEAINQFLRFSKDLTPVYLKNIWVIADYKQQSDIHFREWRKKLGVDNVKILSKNGIEYYYPKRILKLIFETDDLTKIFPNKRIKDPIKYKNVSFSKKDLAEKVAEKLTVNDLENTNNEVFNYILKLP
jgi:predicted ATP-dependent endonuclease of OLD family